MRVTVNYLAQARRAAGRVGEAVELDDGTCLADLVARLGERRGEALRRLLGGALLFVGDEQVRESPRPLRDGDVVTVLAPMAGG